MQSLLQLRQQPEEEEKVTVRLRANSHDTPKLSDFECPVCFEIMVEPVKLQCSHVFCSVCLKNNHKHHFQICPMCRTTLKKQNNGEVLQEMVEDLRYFYPAEFEAQFDKLKRKKLLFGDLYEVEFEIGNHHIELQNFKTDKEGYPINNQFTCFFRIKEPGRHPFKMGDVISHVEFVADKWFKMSGVQKIIPNKPAGNDVQKNLRLKASRPDELTWSNMSWRVFEVPISIHFNPKLEMKPLKLTWQLNYRERFTAETHSFSIPKAFLKPKLTISGQENGLKTPGNGKIIPRSKLQPKAMSVVPLKAMKPVVPQRAVNQVVPKTFNFGKVNAAKK